MFKRVLMALALLAVMASPAAAATIFGFNTYPEYPGDKAAAGTQCEKMAAPVVAPAPVAKHHGKKKHKHGAAAPAAAPAPVKHKHHHHKKVVAPAAQ